MTLSLTLDRRRRATELTLSAAATVAAGAALPLAFGTDRVRGSGGDMGGRRWEVAARLDLRDPAVRATWTQFRKHPTSGHAIRALGSAMRDRAHLDRRVYRTDSTTGGVAAGIAGGVRVGGEYDHTTDRTHLLDAASRPPAGLWERRFDCVPA